MPAYLSPIGNEPQIDTNGDPLTGGKLYTYAAGTTTPAATYTSSSAGTAQANPIILNSRGCPANPVWLQAGQSYKFVITDANDVPLPPTLDGITGINDPAFASSVDEWVLYGATPTYISATSFSVAGDQTNTFQAIRRLKTTNTGGTIYSSVSSSAYNAGTGLTTVVVTNDSGTLDSGLSAVFYGMLSVTSPSIPETTLGKSLRVIASQAAARSAIGMPGGVVIDRAYTEYTTNADINSIIPFDDTGPQNTEGTQILSVSLTPKATTSRVRLRFQGQVVSGSLANFIVAMFSSASATTLRSTWITLDAAYGGQLVLEHEYVPGTTSALTFTVRVGTSAAVNIRLNGTEAARRFGGGSAATLVVEEITP